MSLRQETPHATVLQVVTGHFREGPGYRAYRQHGVPDWLLICTISGLGRFGHDDGELVARPGDWVLLRPGTLHDYGVEGSLKQWDLLWAHFQPRDEWRSLLSWPPVCRGLMRLSLFDTQDGRSILDRFFDVHRTLNSNIRHREMFAMNALEDVFLRCDMHNPLSAAQGDERIRRAMEYVAHRLEAKITLDELARSVGLSTSRLSHLFKAMVGQAPQQYLESCRMRRAVELLRSTTFSVKQIAAAVGYDSPFYFSLRFKAWTKKSPTAFREANARWPGTTSEQPLGRRRERKS